MTTMPDSARAVKRVQRDEIPVMFVAGPDVQSGITQSWDRLETTLGSLRGRRFYGVVAIDGSYRACAQVRGDDDPTVLGLDLGAIPGGSYLSTTLHGEPSAIVPQIRDSVGKLERLAQQSGQRDPDRPVIEFYRRHTELELLVPVTDG